MRSSGSAFGPAFGRPSFAGNTTAPAPVSPSGQAYSAIVRTMPSGVPALTCGQFLSLSPADAFARSGTQFYQFIASCMQTAAPSDKIAAYAIASSATPRSGLNWFFPYVAYKFLNQIGCNTWVSLGSVTTYAGRQTAQSAAIQQYWNQFRISTLSAGDIAIITGIANFICGNLSPKVPRVLTISPAWGARVDGQPWYVNPAGAVSGAVTGAMKQIEAAIAPVIRPAGQVLGDSPVTTILVTGGVIAGLAFLIYTNNEESKLTSARSATNR